MLPTPRVPDQSRRSRLPTPLTSFIGREQEAALAASLLGRDDVRLLTLTGPGGVGKTRLAIQVAGALANSFAGGVHFVPLAPVQDAGAVAATVAHSFGLLETDDSGLAASLADILRDAQLLLVLDNFEHVLSAAPFVAELLGSCPRLRILVTSRSLLRVSGEQALPVPPLDLPAAVSGQSLASLAESAAVRLFVSRARAASPTFQLTEQLAPVVAEICRRLDGLPLAIELAAAQSNVLPPGPLLGHIQARRSLPFTGPRDAPVRLRTLHDTVAWSYDLLPGEQQRLFRILGAFVGGVGLNAIDYVSRRVKNDHLPDDEERVTTINHTEWSFVALATLVDRSLLQQEPWEFEPRFSMLETFRGFASEQLVRSGEEEVIRNAHADWCLELAEGTGLAMLGSGRRRELRRLEADHANLRSAFDWLEQQGDYDRLLRLAAALGPFWYALGHLVEGRRRLQQALGHLTQAAPLPRARAIVALDLVCYILGDQRQSEEHLNESIAVLRELGDIAEVVGTLVWKGWTALHLGNPDTAELVLSEALDLATAIPDPVAADSTRDRVLANLGVVANARGDLRTARLRHEEALDIRRSLDDVIGTVHSLCDLGSLAVDQFRYAEAIACFQECLTLLGDEGYPLVVVNALGRSAVVAAAWGQAERAARLLGAAAAERELFRVGVDLQFDLVAHSQAEAAVRAALGDQRMKAAWLAGRGLSRAEARAEVLAIQPPTGSQDATLSPWISLSKREAEVAVLLIDGRTDREIAETLFISVRTAEGHVARILTKLGVSTRAAAAAAAAAGFSIVPVVRSQTH